MVETLCEDVSCGQGSVAKYVRASGWRGPAHPCVHVSVCPFLVVQEKMAAANGGGKKGGIEGVTAISHHANPNLNKGEGGD